ncbi:hypothetical protein GQ457_03G042180 [Hibiscus cannabinus]
MNIAKRGTNKREYTAFMPKLPGSMANYSHEQNALLTPQQRSKAGLTNHDIPDLPRAKHGLWRQEQKSRAAKIEKQLKARRELKALIKEQLNKFHAHYNQAMVSNHIEDVSKLLVPQWAAPQELATFFWLGSTAIQPALSQFIHDMCIEEAIIDEEMAEIQATCFLYLPFSPVNSSKTGGSASWDIQSMLEKIARVITKAQKLRFKALELVVKKLLNQTEAAELQKGPVTVSIKSRNVVETSKKPKIYIEDRISHFLKTSDTTEHGYMAKEFNMPSASSKSSRDCERGLFLGLSVLDAISEFEDQQRFANGASRSRDLAETSKQPMIHLKDRISSWEKFSRMVEQERIGQGIQQL